MDKRTIIRVTAKAAAIGVALNEVRGVVMAGPVFYGMWKAGVPLAFLIVCGVGGLVASVVLPTLAFKLFRKVARV